MDGTAGNRTGKGRRRDTEVDRDKIRDSWKDRGIDRDRQIVRDEIQTEAKDVT